MDAEGDCEERGCSAFPVDEVHKIAILDCRLANTDRNAGNILVRKGRSGSWELIPIDHGYCLPASFQDVAFEWLYWPQARQPFSPAARDYIAQLNPDKDLSLLAASGIQLGPECQCVFHVSTMLLKMVRVTFFCFNVLSTASPAVRRASEGKRAFHIGVVLQMMIVAGCRLPSAGFLPYMWES